MDRPWYGSAAIAGPEQTEVKNALCCITPYVPPTENTKEWTNLGMPELPQLAHKTDRGGVCCIIPHVPPTENIKEWTNLGMPALPQLAQNRPRWRYVPPTENIKHPMV